MLMQDFLVISKALADESRLRALCALQQGELCVCQIIELLGLAPSTVSRHLSILRQAGLVEGRKEGRWMHYRLPGGSARGAIRDAIQWACGSLSNSADVKRDAARLRKILAMDRKELCSRHCSP
jgi:DNA-binding transcriptional ArsR family regulator